MFDYVSRKEYEQERDARVRAEERAESLREQCATLTELLREAMKAPADVLDRFQPKPETHPAFAGPSGPVRMTAAEILQMPVYGKRDMAARHRRYQKALQREEEERQQQTREERRANLTPEELEQLDQLVENNGHA